MEKLQMFLQLLAIVDLAGIAFFVIIAAATMADIHAKVNEMYYEFINGEWRFFK